MTKMKQATLFSLKSWIKVPVEDKCKDVLTDHDATESEILNALLTLKKKNLSKNEIFSAGLDLILEQLEKHPSPTVGYEARMVRNRWKLNNSTPDIVDDEEPPNKKRRTVREIEICEIKMTSKQHIEHGELQAINHSLRQLPKQKVFTNKTDESMLSVASNSKKRVLKSQTVNKATYNNIIHKLCDAVQLFTAELGEQEVRLYFEKLSY